MKTALKKQRKMMNRSAKSKMPIWTATMKERKRKLSVRRVIAQMLRRPILRKSLLCPPRRNGKGNAKMSTTT